MENAVNHTSRIEIKRGHSPTWFTNWKFIVGGIIIVIALVIVGLSYSIIRQPGSTQMS